jgi:hypothetical protein
MLDSCLVDTAPAPLSAGTPPSGVLSGAARANPTVCQCGKIDVEEEGWVALIANDPITHFFGAGECHERRFEELDSSSMAEWIVESRAFADILREVELQGLCRRFTPLGDLKEMYEMYLEAARAYDAAATEHHGE